MAIPPKRGRFLKPGEENLIASEELEDIPEASVIPEGSGIKQVDHQRESLPTFRWRSHFLYLLEKSRLVIEYFFPIIILEFW